MTYNKEYIERLLGQFMDGETTEQEEQFLTEYFSTSNSIPEEWEAYREMFASFATDAYDFSEKELSTFVKEEAPKPRNVKMWLWLAAACVAALLVVFHAPPREEAKQVAKVEDSIPVKVKKLDTMKSEPLLPLAHKSLIAQVMNTKPSSVEHHNNEQVSVSAEENTFENQQYALSLDEDEDDYVIQASTASQDPNLVTEFVGKLVETCKAQKIELDCKSTSDKNASTDIYVFKEVERIDVFGRMIQVACWYDNTLPGYRLTLSNRQFIFELQDRQNNIQYLWFAERVRDSIILNCARSTIGSQILSPCYRDFVRRFKNNYSM